MIVLQWIARCKGRLVSVSHCRRIFSVAISPSSHLHSAARESIFSIPNSPGSCKLTRFDLFLLCQCRFQCVFSNAPPTDSSEAPNLLPQFLQNGKNMVYQGTEGDLKTEAQKPISQKSRPWGRSEGRESDDEHLVCPGCGVFMQDSNTKAPGFFIRPAEKEQKNIIDVKHVLQEGKRVESKVEETQPDVTLTVDGKTPKKVEKPVVCARCHSLRHYGQVKDESVENLLPDFDFDHTVGARLVKTTKSRSTVVMVVDSVDFDGSFPRRAAALVSRAMEEGETAWKEGKSGNVPRLVLAVTKIDLLPTQVTPVRLENWVRQRARFGGALKLHGVHLISAHKDWGIWNLAEHIKELAGPRGSVWVIGAQNAGKSTLINAIGKHVGGGKVTQLTEAPVPGTTLGIIRIEGILPAKAKLYDTPGLLHPHQISTRLNREEQKMVQIRKELKPRTYRLKAGQVVHVGGLMRLDIQEASVETIYATIWASPHIPLHMSKIENANGIWQNHFGRQLQPPIGEERISELGKWERRELKVLGNSWDFSSVDVAAAGLGWFSLSLKGDATLAVWTYDGVDITVRSALILHRAHIFEKSGFTVSKVVSKADRSKNYLSEKKNKNSKGEKCEDLRTEMTYEEVVK